MPRFLFVVALSILFGCAAAPRYSVVQMPLREADLYPLSSTKEEVTVAVDEIRSPDRAERYFGTNLVEQAIVPVNITISNHSEHPYQVGPADILVYRGTAVIDPLPIAQVVDVAERVTGEDREHLEEYFTSLAFAETSVSPHSSYQGVLFFPIAEERKENRLFSAISLFQQSRNRLDVIVTNTETRERLRFGPFTLSE